MAFNEDYKADYASNITSLKDKAREIEVYLARDKQDSERMREYSRTLDRLYEELKRSRQSYIGI